MGLQHLQARLYLMLSLLLVCDYTQLASAQECMKIFKIAKNTKDNTMKHVPSHYRVQFKSTLKAVRRQHTTEISHNTDETNHLKKAKQEFQ